MAGREPEKGDGQEREAARGSSIAYAAGLSIFFSTLSCMGLGWVLDRQFGTRWMMVAGIVLGAAVGFYQFIRIISRLNK
ncbi:MAG TPA: AtpZ/AtpI family protein [Pyrinomonadaceae bacterium]|nr:AtpZ/AtpI family protein [Pyrinomonadaceae bacterium]